MLVAVSPLVFRGLAMVAMAAIGQALPGVGDFGRFSGIPEIGLAGVLIMTQATALIVLDLRVGIGRPGDG
jgi:hypothetical protein